MCFTNFTDPQTDENVRFENVLYEGIIEEGVVRHEVITVLGYEGTDIEILGGNQFDIIWFGRWKYALCF